MSGGGRDRGAELDAEWDRLEACYLERLRLVAAGEVGLADRLRAAAWESVRLALECPRDARLLVVEPPVAGRRGQRRQRLLTARLAAMLDAWIAAEEVPGASPLLTGWIIATFYGVFHRSLAGGREEGLPAEVPRLMFLIVSAYAGAEAAAAELDLPPPAWLEGREHP